MAFVGTKYRLPVAAYFLSACLVLLLSVPNLPLPFGTDQAVLASGAGVLNAGGVLYRDFWGTGQPAAFLFYFLGGEFFGYSEVGVHTFELLYHLGFCILLVYTLRNEFAHRWLATLVPVATVGAYYMVARPSSLTMPEILAAFPLYVCAWFAGHTWRTSRLRTLGFFCSGLAGGVAVLFKLDLAPLPIGFWTAAVIVSARVYHHRSAAIVNQRIAPALGGFMLVLVTACAWFWSQNALAELYRTTIAQSSGWEPDQPAAVLRYMREFAPWVLLAAVGSFFLPDRLLTKPFWAAMTTWVVLGAATVALETTVWSPARFLVLVAPVGILAIRGLDQLLVLARRTTPALTWRVPVAALIAATLVLIPEMWHWTAKARALTSGALRNDPQQVDRFQSRISPDYLHVRRATQFLSAPSALPGTVYVFGSPLYLWMSGRRPALPVNGWDLDSRNALEWIGLTAQLRSNPPAYIFVDPAYARLIATVSPDLKTWIEGTYSAAESSESGVWYRLRL